MNAYLLIKTIHILSSVLLVGTGFGSAFYLFFIHRSKNLQAIAEVSRLVVRADWWFTTPAVIIQPLSGLALMQMRGWSVTQDWILAALILYAIAGACWLPVVWIQIQLKRIAHECIDQGRSLPSRYWQLAKYWEWLGYPAFTAMLIIYLLMVLKQIVFFE
ncbi:MAG: DUF2269 domain-containing protein [Burkholderiaceae bacterium]|nr:MAG: DUF2269 domain-containing protein [Burkholderiaceae bacterium]